MLIMINLQAGGDETGQSSEKVQKLRYGQICVFVLLYTDLYFIFHNHINSNCMRVSDLQRSCKDSPGAAIKDSPGAAI